MSPGEVRLDGRIDYPDGQWSGAKAVGQVVRGTLEHDDEPWMDPVADVFWYETFMERIARSTAAERRVAPARSAPAGTA